MPADSKSTWLTTSPLTAEEREAVLASVGDTLTEREAAALLQCTVKELRAKMAARRR